MNERCYDLFWGIGGGLSVATPSSTCIDAVLQSDMNMLCTFITGLMERRKNVEIWFSAYMLFRLIAVPSVIKKSDRHTYNYFETTPPKAVYLLKINTFNCNLLPITSAIMSSDV